MDVGTVFRIVPALALLAALFSLRAQDGIKVWMRGEIKLLRKETKVLRGELEAMRRHVGMMEPDD